MRQQPSSHYEHDQQLYVPSGVDIAVPYIVIEGLCWIGLPWCAVCIRASSAEALGRKGPNRSQQKPASASKQHQRKVGPQQLRGDLMLASCHFQDSILGRHANP